MQKLDKVQVQNLCRKPETVQRAADLYTLAKVRTGPGSGHELGAGASALAVICAYLASEELGNGDVLENMTQTSSCLHPKIFKRTLNIVRKVLSAARNETKQKLSYKSLLNELQFSNAQFMLSCMQDVEKYLKATKELSGALASAQDAITLAVFLWTCRVIGLKKRQDMKNMYKKYQVDKEDVREIGFILEESCQDVADEIKRKTKALKSSEPGPSTLPSKSTQATSPPKPPHATANATASPTKTPILKRVKSLQEQLMEEGLPKTPVRKKAKTAGSYRTINTREHKLSAAFPSTSKSNTPSGASSSRATLDLQPFASQPSDPDASNVTEEEAETEALLVESRSSTSSVPFTPQRPKRSTLFPKTPGEFDLTPRPRAQRRVAAMLEENGMDQDESEDRRRGRCRAA
ncbi:hypothetical protein QCA50_006667 [Cerrena zonata]|uniref:Origin recognition complex subunit 6 n=1 Tax=Cerrena zonata TaxID=2478898 RepID=A0AAW0G8N7_9APHY